MGRTRISKARELEATAIMNLYDGNQRHRRISLYIADAGGDTSGSVYWSVDGEYVEGLVVTAEPFETPAELLERLLLEERRSL